MVLQPQNDKNSHSRGQITTRYVLVFFDSHMHTELLWGNDLLPLGKSRYTTVPRRHRIISDRRSSLKIVAADWEIPFPCVTLQEEIGSGAFGLIYHGVIACSHQPDCVEIAVKVLKRKSSRCAQLAFKVVYASSCYRATNIKWQVLY